MLLLLGPPSGGGGGGGFVNPLSAFSPVIQLEARAGYLWQEFDNSRATPASADGHRVGQARDVFTPATYYTALSAGARPTLRIDGSGYWWLEFDGIANVLAFIGVALAADFTVYCTGRRNAAGGFFLPLCGPTTPLLGIYSDNRTYFVNDAADNVSAAYSGPNGTDALFRWRRAVTTNNVYLQRSGVTEALLNTRAGTATFSRVGARTEFTAGRYGLITAFASDLAAGDKTTVESYATTWWGVTP